MKTPIENEATKAQAREWAANLGTLAAGHASSQRAIPMRRSTILDHLRRGRKEQIDHKIKAHMFIMGQ